MASVFFRGEFGDGTHGSGSASTISMDQENCMGGERVGEHNVMPMELAIKREIAYRMKVGKLQLRPGAGAGTSRFQLDDTFSKGPPPIPSPVSVGMKRKASSSNVQFSSVQQSYPSGSRRPFQSHPDNLFCKYCQLTCNSMQCLKEHRQSDKHKANVQKFIESPLNRRENGGKQKWCKVCRVPCSDERAYAQHLAGKKHAAAFSAKKAKDEAHKEVMKIRWEELEWEMV